MVDTYIYTTMVGSGKLTLCVKDSELAAAMMAVVRKKIYEAMDVSDYEKVAQLAHEANDLSKGTAIAFAKDAVEEPEEEVNVDLQTGEIIADKSEAEHGLIRC